MKGKVLIVDDEPDAVELVAYNLKQAGYSVATAQDGAEALQRVKASIPDMILLDVMLPAVDGMELCKILRNSAETARLPIIMLTARAAEIDRVLGLELGADDYITKPFSPRELLLRIKKVLERSAVPPKEQRFQEGGLEVDVLRHRVTVEAKVIDLTATEFKLLVALIETPGLVKTREHLLRVVWDYSRFVDTRTVDTHVRRLRQKLGKAADSIETLRGVGYRFMAS